MNDHIGQDVYSFEQMCEDNGTRKNKRKARITMKMLRKRHLNAEDGHDTYNRRIYSRHSR